MAAGDQFLKHLVVDRGTIADAEKQSQWASKKLVWVPHTDQGYVSGSIKGDDGDFVEVEFEDGKRHRFNKDDIQKMNPPKYEKVEDMAELACLNEASVLHNLRDRYYSGLIYTYSGLFCVVVNPYRLFPIYTDKVIEMYKGKKRHEVPPHVYAITDSAYMHMLQDRENQSILCTGESGAGKTENTKKVIQYLAVVAGASHKQQKPGPRRRTSSTSLQQKAGLAPGQGELESQLLQANPLLEAFGNAKTVKNDNSSRFGKFIRIFFNQHGYISGATIDTYLLEKARVCFQSPEERLFHIFYQLLNGADQKLREEIFLLKAEEYNYMRNGLVKIPGINDENDFEDTREAMDIMQMTPEEQTGIFRVVSAVLLFGNMKFKQDRSSDQALFVETTVPQRICKLIGLPISDFQKGLLRPRITVGREMVNKAQNLDQVEYSSQALAKALYERLFKWIVYRINRSLSQITHGFHFIGILDIAGFEIFKLNSFEQLCINYTNEKLQQLFNHTMFVLEQEEYRLEGIEWNFIDFGLDLQPCIDLIERPMGILALLDEECWFPKATDKTFVEKVLKEQKSNTSIRKSDFRSGSDFVVQHYAGEVEYVTQNWLIKNMDPLNDTIVDLLSSSTDKLVSELWKDTANIIGMGAKDQTPSKFGSSVAKKGMFRTVGQLYKEQLIKLMGTLSNTNPHFVRCIIPNHEKKAGKLVAPLVLEQLKCNGVLEGIRICRQGFPNRILFQEFRQRYEILAPGCIPKGFMDARKSCMKILDVLSIDKSLYRIGQSKIFFRSGVVVHLEEERDMKLTEIITCFQARCRGYLGRKAYLARVQQQVAIKLVQKNVAKYLMLRDWNWWRLFTKIKPLLRVTKNEEDKTRMEEEVRKLTEKMDYHNEEKKQQEILLEQVQKENDELQEQLRYEKSQAEENFEMRHLLEGKKQELDSAVKDLQAQIEDDEVRTHKMASEAAELLTRVADMENNLESEEGKVQKLQMEKLTLEAQLNRLSEETSSQNEVLTKVAREKKVGDEKLEDLLNHIQTEEERNKTLNRAKIKLEGSQQELQAKFERESKLRNDGEKERRQLAMELSSLSEQLNEAKQYIDELRYALERREAELKELTIRLDDETHAHMLAEKSRRELSNLVTELQEDIEAERESKRRLEETRRQLTSELENLNVNLEESALGMHSAHEMKAHSETQLALLQKQMDEFQNEHEVLIAQLRKKHSDTLHDLSEQLDNSKRNKTNTESKLNNSNKENDSLKQELQQSQTRTSDQSRKIKGLEQQLADLQQQLTEYKLQNSELSSYNTKLQQSNNQNSNSVLDLESKISNLEKQKHSLESELGNTTENFESESNARLNLQKQMKAMDQEMIKLQEQADEEEASGTNLLRTNATLQQQLQDLKKKFEDIESSHDDALNSKKKLERDLDSVAQANQDLKANAEALAKSKKRLQQELDDVIHDLETQRANFANLEKKQKKFDSAFADERATAEQLAQERDMADKEARQATTRLLALKGEMEDLTDRFEDVDRTKNRLQAELQAINESSSSTGKNVQDLEKLRRNLENQLSEAKQQLEEVEDELMLSEDAKLRLEVNLQAAKTNFARDLASKEEQNDEIKKALTRQIHEFEERVEEEKKQKQTSFNQRKKLEADYKELDLQVDAIATQKEDALRQARRFQAQVKDITRELEELNLQKADAINSQKEIEKRAKGLENELQLSQDALATAQRSQKSSDTDRDEAHDEVENLQTKFTAMQEEKRKIESRFSDVEAELEEERNAAEEAEDKCRKFQTQNDALSVEIGNLQNQNQKIEAMKTSLDKQLKEVKTKLDDSEAEMSRKYKAKVSSLDARVISLEEQLETAVRDKSTFQRQIRRWDKKLKDSVVQSDENKRVGEQYKEQYEKTLSRMKIKQRQLEETEDEVNKLKNDKRRLQREVDELSDQAERAQKQYESLQARHSSTRRGAGKLYSGRSHYRGDSTMDDDNLDDDDASATSH
eukprot:TRINITY_DN7830_c0_g1_i1.p1 TRINITY_DN7830_c0_g1~~TRINITY_DN7830_c0_g1_i1.p1  ORF type:complete len:1974 (-),score=571.80 TRINITY_DN7830_c0_g1_i1:235-6156(-)